MKKLNVGIIGCKTIATAAFVSVYSVAMDMIYLSAKRNHEVVAGEE